MDKKQKPPTAQEDLFRQAMDGVVPLKPSPATISKTPPTDNRLRATTGTSEQTTELPVWERHAIDTHDGPTHRKNGVRLKVMQRLKRGHFPVGDQLDLHNMRTGAARAALLDFIQRARIRKLECVRVIHGKGLRSSNGPRLKTMARETLRAHPQVLAFTACKPADGGDGAMDVLLRPGHPGTKP